MVRSVLLLAVALLPQRVAAADCSGEGGQCFDKATHNVSAVLGSSSLLQKGRPVKDHLSLPPVFHLADSSSSSIPGLPGLPGFGGSSGSPIGKPVTAYATAWAAASGTGGCSMPKTSYNFDTGMCLGASPSKDKAKDGNNDMKHLAHRNAMCGQVLSVDCGVGPTDIIAVSYCKEKPESDCMMDMVYGTYEKATGINPNSGSKITTGCTVQLTDKAAIKGGDMSCYMRPNQEATQYFCSFGLYNTRGRMVKSMSYGGIDGKWNSGSGYMDFHHGNGVTFDNKDTKVKVKFEDGGSHEFKYGECLKNSGIDVGGKPSPPYQWH